MGAEQYVEFGEGVSIQDAFVKVVEQALYEYGHSGYSGTIAEKGQCRELKGKFKPAVDEKDIIQAAEDFAYHCMDDYDAWWDDKWGPSAGFHVKDDLYCFFGWASS